MAMSDSGETGVERGERCVGDGEGSVNTGNSAT